MIVRAYLGNILAENLYAHALPIFFSENHFSFQTPLWRKGLFPPRLGGNPKIGLIIDGGC
ncbi:MAG: hypothetical protein D5S03_00700 [Desulfonatronospira sp. MSAO_Bac3]|nr:MAG: hypothetical protein D5S03_00700 [Desulfonatronospira sp. MSAO_Bac3]